MAPFFDRAMYEIMLNLDGASGKNLYEQVYEHIKKEIQLGNIRCGEKLPSTRLLSAQLDVSRSTVQLAYEQLLSEGYIESVPCRGYFACQMEELYQLDTCTVSKIEEDPPKEEKFRYDFTPNGIDLEHFPYATWRKLSREVLQDDQKELFLLGDARGEHALRTVIADYLHQARGMNVQPEQIVIGAGNDYLQMLLSQIIGTDGHRIAMESPTYRHAYDIFRQLGYDCCTVSMDRQGMNLDELKRSGADIAYVMPSHQYPMGTVMPITRRQELLQWAQEREGRYLIEDDYDSEFRYIGKPIPALQGSDVHGKVIYIGTFSRSIAPAIRVSYLVLPVQLLERYEEVGRRFSCTVSRIDQGILRLFMERGYYERHLNKMRALYKNKHDILLGEIRRIDGVKQILGERAGVHILVQLSSDVTEETRVAEAAKVGVKVYPLSEYCIDQSRQEPSILLGFATLSEQAIQEAAALLRQAWNEKAL
jgi:GntR family transcriptional regulator/MocR family aminotransferase